MSRVISASVHGAVNASWMILQPGREDMMIAAHAVALGVTLVTNNIRKFERVDGLSVENWGECAKDGR